MGLASDHPLKEGELISFENLEDEVQQRLTLKKQLDSIVREASGLRVVHGIKGEDVQVSTSDSTTPVPVAQAAESTDAVTSSSTSAPAAEVAERTAEEKPAEAPSS
jgi:histidyl-tRNA synthetase